MKQPLSLAALLLASVSLAACAVQQPPAATAAASPAGSMQAQPTAEDQRLLAFLDAAFDQQVALSPQSLTALGSKERYHELDDYTDAQSQRQLALAEAQLAQLRSSFNRERLSPSARLSYDLFVDSVERTRRGQEWRWHSLPVTTTGSPAGSLPVFLINQHRIDSVADAEAYIARLAAVERVMGEMRDRVIRQAEMGIVPPRFVFAPVRADARRVISGAPFEAGEDSTIMADFRRKVTALDVSQAEKDRLIGQARAALSGPFRRGYDTFFAALDTIEPKAPAQHGAWAMPRGGEYYAHQLRQQTTTDLSAEEIHQIGLREVDRIQGEMRRIMARVGYTGTLQQFFQHIRTDPQFQYPNTAAGRESYLADARRFIAQVMEVAPKYFRRLPQAALEVRAVEEWRQETAPVAFYNRPAPDGSRPGIYYVNLADMTQVLRPQIEGISYHEGAPGHHFQIALAQELPGIPKFRRLGGYGAYVEGWALYSERLGQEFGFYQDPYSEFGMQSLELWRAVRLVLDTGIHAKRWTREQAIQYFMENSLLSERDATREVERYIVWPGQATSYKIGQLRIFELRDRARQALGERFDIRDFHAAVLENGALPLDELERQVDAYIAAARR